MNFKLKLAGIFAGIVGVVALTSAISTENVPLEVGNHAPEFSAINAYGNTVHMSDFEGQDVILNFWSIRDAESRIRNVRLEREAERTGAKYVSLCVDPDMDIALEVIKADGLTAENQYFADGMISDDYLLNHGVRTVKIDPFGIVAKID